MKVRDLVKALSEKSPDPAYRAFMDWFNDNSDRLPEACEELGVTPPEEGPGLFRRLQERVIPVFKKEGG